MRKLLQISVLGTCMVLAAGAAQAQATIFNTGDPSTATVALGVNAFGHLNTEVGAVSVNFVPPVPGVTPRTGLAFRFPDGDFYDALAWGCLCEGWGVSIGGMAPNLPDTRTAYATEDVLFAGNSTHGPGTRNLTLEGFTSTASSATSTVHMTNEPGLQISHHFMPASSASDVLFEGTVTITNTSATALENLRYVRVVDWDVPPTESADVVTIQGVDGATFLDRQGASCDPNVRPCPLPASGGLGFYPPDPLLTQTGFPPVATRERDFTDLSVGDLGAYFRFNFGTLDPGESITFWIYYGAAGTEAAALAALSSVDADLYSLGQSSSVGGGDPALGTPATYILGFRFEEVDTPIPEPGTLALVGVMLVGLVRKRLRTA